MGYSTSTTTLERAKPWLKNLMQGQGDRWVLPEGASPHKFAMKIREALKIAEDNPQYIPELAHAKDRFRIEIVDKRTVQAVYRSPDIAPIANEVIHTGLANGSKGPVDVVSVGNAEQIIQLWHNAQPSNERFHFPQNSLSLDELVKLYVWCKNDRPIEWYILRGANGEITLCPYFKGVEAVEWTPEDGL